MIEQKKKLRLDEIQIDSFVTTDKLDATATIKGGFDTYFNCASQVKRNGEWFCEPEFPL
jgi:hypothetical protein